MAAVMDEPILVTGAAGFIGFHVTRRLLSQGRRVVGVDSLTPYYDPALKDARRAELAKSNHFDFVKLDLADRDATHKLFRDYGFPYVVHLAAQAGVRHSISHPEAYVDANLQGFANVLEGCRHNGCKHLIFASSSSVYGANTKLPFRASDNVDHPISMYAASKKANELMAHSYAHLFRLPVTGLRFFTVYGPWGRPDMALFLFTKAILEGRPIDVFNHGQMVRDFTYIDDIVEGVIRVSDRTAEPAPDFDSSNPDPATSNAPYRVFNIGNNQPTPLMDYISALESALGMKANKNFLPMQAGDVPATAANTDALNEWVGFKPGTAVTTGIANFVAWYLKHYDVRTPAATAASDDV